MMILRIIIIVENIKHPQTTKTISFVQMNVCIYIPHLSHIMSQGGLQFYLSEIERQLVKAPLVAAISPYLISLTHPTHA